MKRAVLCVFAVLAFGCGDDSTPATSPDAGIDASGPDAPDFGSPSTTYPAFMPDFGQIINNGGPVFANMIIVTMTWNGDTGQDTYDTFGDTIGASNFWHAVNSEYGVGATTSGTANHIHLDRTANPPPGNDSAARSFVLNGITSGLLPAPTNQTIYALYIPPDVTFTGGCTSFGGYHSELTGSSHHFAYTIIMNCSGIGNATNSASHELNEAATDPYPQSNAAWVGFDDDHVAYELMLAEYDEVGDACWDPATGFYTFDDHETGFQYTVQRQWSNASAASGRSPCVPALPEPYYGVTILPGQTETVTVNFRSLGIATTNTKGIKVAMGDSRTFTVGFYSDRFASRPWTLTASVPAMLPGSTLNNGSAMVMIDKTSGLNGEKAHITVTPMAYNSTGGTYIELISNLTGFERHITPFLIAPQ
jgi:hypothetical protein